MTDYVATKAPGTQLLPISDLPQIFNYYDNTCIIDALITSYQGITYAQTFANDGTKIIYQSQWTPMEEMPDGSKFVKIFINFAGIKKSREITLDKEGVIHKTNWD